MIFENKKRKKPGSPASRRLKISSAAALFRLLTPSRWQILEQLQKNGPSGLRALARSLSRDPSAVHRDLAPLLDRGLVAKDESGRLHVPFARIHTEFDLAKAA